MDGRTSARAKTAGKQTAQGHGGTVEQQIKALHAQLMEATLKHDPSFLENYLADDYMAIRNDGKLTTKVQEIENYRSGATKYESIEIREATVRIHGNTAIYNSLNSIKATINGKPFSGDVRNTRVWVKQNGDWRIVAFQATQVAPRASKPRNPSGVLTAQVIRYWSKGIPGEPAKSKITG